MTSTFYLLKARLSLNLDCGYFQTVSVMLKSRRLWVGLGFLSKETSTQQKLGRSIKGPTRVLSK